MEGVFLDNSDGFGFGYLTVGADYDVSRRFFIGLEGKYLFTEEADYAGVVGVDLNGVAPILKVGIRF